MDAMEVASIYSAKAVEYLVAVGYLLLFVPFWRFVNGSQGLPQPLRVAAPVRRPESWFALPEGLFLHPGHGWARPNGGELVTVGYDDFAHKLIGPVDVLDLPPVGASLAQGDPAWRFAIGDKAVDMLSPVGGTVVARNDAAAASGGRVEDPYGDGWLLKVKPTRWVSDTKQLLEGELARKWVESVAEKLRMQVGPEVGQVLQDGGVPVHGIAQELDAERWDEIARAYLRS